MDANRVKDHAGDPPKTPLPEPDNDNITVLTSKLPNEPILPWNRYDSPWLESEESAESTESADSAESAESAAVAASAESVAAPPAAASSESASPAPVPVVSSAQGEAVSPNPPVTSLPASPGEEATPDETTAAEGIAPPLPTTHYLIDLAFEGTTD
ncbi:hypothetical protein OOK60_15870 [Trichothermofontia sichuanensis B231]|uniref:hypothetical protein n=1 Tax=Trichothermofontia sichuanensis TaxID=3045816 RepID=UPI002248673D|nr:hypothetical protein [Trichothermofontia sichuanensis]UZQ53949.1 hypothetical protein OOK60_15870 [Trichothermofontia sichuanensis B231]